MITDKPEPLEGAVYISTGREPCEIMTDELEPLEGAAYAYMKIVKTCSGDYVAPSRGSLKYLSCTQGSRPVLMYIAPPGLSIQTPFRSTNE